MVKGTIREATATIHILKTILYKVGLRKVDRKHVKLKVLCYFFLWYLGEMPGLNKMFK